ncbi:MAG: D-glycerate dehydrogenase [Rhodothermales bacterium]
MMPKRVFVTRKIADEALSRLRAHAEVDLWTDDLPPDYTALTQRVADCDGLLCLLTDTVDAALISNSPKLKVISQMAVGYDNIDVTAATAQGIAVGHTPGVLSDSTADLTWALILGVARRVVESMQFIADGQWKTWYPLGLLGMDLKGATLGIVGMGRIGQAVARRAQGFDMNVLYAGPRKKEGIAAEYVSMDRLLAESDIVTLHCPLRPETHHLMDAAAFAQMKRGSILVNTARGGVVEQGALLEAVQSGHLAGAGLDVTDPEPIDPAHPIMHEPRIIVTPHIGSASVWTRQKMSEMSVDNLLAGLSGEPLPYTVNPEVRPAP